MSTAQATIEQDGVDRRIPMGRLRDTNAVIKRNLLQYIRVPQLLVFSTIQPIIFVLMFRFVFGGSIDTGRIPYVDYLMPGIFLQVVVFGSLATAIGLATDLKSGLMERFHALPMWTPAVLVGRTIADLIRNVFVVILMMIVGFLVGWRIHTSLFSLLPGISLVLLFGFAMSWIFATVGLAVKDPETAQAVKDQPDFQWEASAESMAAFLAGLRREYGSADGYLRANGARSSLVDRLKAALLV